MGKFINTMRYHIFEKQASNRSSNDARDRSIEISDQTSTDCLIISTVYHWNIIMKAKITIKRNTKKKKIFLT